MEGFPKEFLYVLLFAGIVLFQYLVKRFAPQRQPEAEAEPLWEFPEEGTELQAPPVARATAGHFGRSGAPSAPAAPRGRRFSRRSLFGSPRDLQNAVVLATILGPCRAMEAPGDNAGAESQREMTR